LKHSINIALALSLCVIQAFAVPASPGVKTATIGNQQFSFHHFGDEYFSWAVSEDGYTILSDSAGHWVYALPGVNGALVKSNQLYRPADPAAPALARELQPSESWLRQQNLGIRLDNQSPSRNRENRVDGSWNLLLIMIKFPDQGSNYPPENFEAMMNDENYAGTGSFRDFYLDQSYGVFETNAAVSQWYTAELPHNHYGYDEGFDVARDLVVEAVLAADADVDFSQYDNSGNGTVDALLIVHSGNGAEEGNHSNIWSHRWSLGGSQLELDGVIINDYTIQPEEQGDYQANIGVYVHEFGHNLGLPDLYDTDYSSSGLDTWCVMSGGSWGGGGPGGNAAVPVSFSAWCKSQLGWSTITETDSELLDYPLDASYLNNEIVRLNVLENPGEYFLIENRQQVGWDLHQPGAGIMIFHVDEHVWGNSDEEHYLVDLEQADGNRDLNNNGNGDSGDPFPGQTDNHSFDNYSIPSSRPYSGANSLLGVNAVSASADQMQATFFQLFSHQRIKATAWRVIWDDDEDQWPESDNTIEIAFEFENDGQDVSSLQIILQTESWFDIEENTANFDAISAGESFDNFALPFRIVIHSDVTPGDYEIRFVCEDESGWLQEFATIIPVGRSDVLILNKAPEQSNSARIISALESANYTWQDRYIAGDCLLATDIDQYETLIYLSAARHNPLCETEEDLLRERLIDGAQLLILGQYLFENASVEFQEFLGVQAGESHLNNQELLGLAAGGLFEDDERLLLNGSNGEWNQEFPATGIDPISAQVILRWASDDIVSAVRNEYPGDHEEPGRMIMCAFSPEAIHHAGPLLSLEQTMNRFMNWLEDGSTVGVDLHGTRPRQSEIGMYPNPFNPASILRFELTSASTAKLRVFNVQGSLIAKSELGLLQAGWHEHSLDFSNYSSGLYFVELRVKGQNVRRTKAMLIR
jgi:immune inhibitor A